MQLQINQYRVVLATYLKPLWSQTLGLAVLLLGGTGLKLLSPQILGAFIDTAVAGGALPELIRQALLFLGAALFIQLISVAETYQAANIGLRATNQLRADLALHCLRLDMSFHNQRTPGELIERVDGDVGHLANFFSRFVIDIVGNLLLMIGIFFFLFWIDWRVGAALGGFTLITLLVINSLRNVAVPHFREARQASAELFGFLEERLSGVEDVRANGAVAYVMRRFYERARLTLRKGVKASLVGVSAFGFTAVLFALGVIIALGVGGFLFQNGVVTIGAVYLIFRYTELLTQPIERINRQIQDLQQAGAALVRIQDILAIQSRVQDKGQTALPAGALAVEFGNVAFSYALPDGANTPLPERTLDNISFSLPPGAILGLLGRTGSGKTTLTRLLVRLYNPTQGVIRLGGVELPELQMAAIRRQVAMVTQEIQLFHASVRQNLTLFDPAIPDERILQALRELGLWDWYQSLPDGLETLLVGGGGGLSAGEAQLLAFVRVFLKDPGLIILDEASSRLDPATEQLLERAIDRLLAGRTAIIIAHRLATVQRADRIMILEGGRCLEVGLRQQLAANPDSHFAHLLKTGLEEILR
jgi:ATP-binding cassette subfamily B protein/ATP-binding cassette subfamily C protein